MTTTTWTAGQAITLRAAACQTRELRAGLHILHLPVITGFRFTATGNAS